MKKGYKQTKVGVIPEDWDAIQIRALTSEVGDGIHSTPIYSNNGEYFFINGNNLINGKVVVTTDTKRADLSEFKKHKNNLGERTIFLSINGTIGNLALYYGESIILGKSAAYLNVKKEVSKRYIYFSLQTQSVKQFFEDGLTGTTIRNLGLGTIRQTPIAVPTDKKEQTAIATALSDTDALIQSLEKLIAKKRLIKQGAMQELLKPKEGWAVKKLGEVAVIIMGQSPRSSNYNLQGIGLPLVQGNADVDNRKTIIRSYTSEITKRCFSGDIIMTVRAPVGEISKAVFDACIGRGVCAIRYPNEYLYHYLINKEASWAQLSKGSTFDSVNSADVKALEINLPRDEQEQTRIAAILSDMDAEISTLETKLAKYKQVKQGMMQNLLTGRIRLLKGKQ